MIVSWKILKPKNSIISAISETTSLDGLEELRVFELGKSGRITNMMKSLGNMKEIERKIAGKELNILKQSVSGAIEKKTITARFRN